MTSADTMMMSWMLLIVDVADAEPGLCVRPASAGSTRARPNGGPKNCSQHEAEGLHEHQRAADRGDQEDQGRRVLLAQRPVGDALDDQRHAAGGDHGAD